MSPRRWSTALVLLGLAVLALPARAHHSSGMFDTARTVSLSGTVREFQWTSPHCWIQVLVPAGAGTEEWSIEMAAPIQLLRLGWKPVTLKPGDKVTIVAFPARDGSRGAMFKSATGADGRPIGPAR